MLGINNYSTNLTQSTSTPVFKGRGVKFLKQMKKSPNKIEKKQQGLFSKLITYLAEKRVKSLTKMAKPQGKNAINYSDAHSIKSGVEGVKLSISATKLIK